MTQLLILSCIAIVVLAALLVAQAREAAAEREEWKNERRFLIDRAIAQHVGEVIALEREDSRKSQSREDAAPRPLLEGLS
jgi:uncharacterized membrane protein